MNMSEASALMTQGSIPRHLWRFALPIFWGNLFQQLYNVVDSLVVGNFLGSDALAAVASSGNIIFLLVGLFNGVFIGAGVVISRYFGARDDRGLQTAIHTTAALGVVSGVLVSVIGTLLAPQLLVWMDTPQSVLPNSIAYFRTYFMGSVFSVLYNTATGIFQAVGDSRHPLYYLIVSSVTNVLLDVLLIAGLGMGVEGAALATVLSQALSAGLAFHRLIHTTGPYRVWIRKIRLNAGMLRQVLAVGLPSGLQNSIISIANVVVQSSINLYGAAAMAGCGSYSKIEGFAFLPVTSCAMAMATFVGQNLGAKEYERAKKGSRIGIAAAMIIAECVSTLIFIFSPWLIGLFNADPQVVSYGVLMARTVTLFFCLPALSHAVAGVLRGAGRSIVPMVVMMVCWCVVRVSYILLIARSSGNIQLVFWAYPITWALSSICFLVYYFKADWLHYLDKKS